MTKSAKRDRDVTLRHITDRERLASESMGGPMATGLGLAPDALVWKKSGIGLDEAAAILNAVDYQAGRYRESQKQLDARLTPTEIIEQANGTAALADALVDRIQHMDASISAYVSMVAGDVYGDLRFAENGMPWLIRLAALMRHAGCEVKANSRTTVTGRTAHRDLLLSVIVDAISEAAPTVAKSRRATIAARLMSAAFDIKVPTSKSKIQKAISRTKCP